MTSAARSSAGRERTPPGYDKKQVDAFLDAAGIRLGAMECPGQARGTDHWLAMAILAGWAKWADLTRFSTGRLREGAPAQRRWTPFGRMFATRSSGQATAGMSGRR